MALEPNGPEASGALERAQAMDPRPRTWRLYRFRGPPVQPTQNKGPEVQAPESGQNKGPEIRAFVFVD